MREYVSHKRVKAAKIVATSLQPSDSITIYVEGWEEFQFPPAERFLAARDGDYLVQYEDGYMSVSPAKVFEDGYVELVSDDDGFDFGTAIKLMKKGFRVARAGWSGKDMWLSLSGDGVREIPASAFWSPNNSSYATENGGTAKVLPCVTMKTATGEILMGWLASQTDMLSEDWVIVATEAEVSDA